MEWTVVLAGPARKSLKRIPAGDKSRILAALAEMQQNPFQGDIRNVAGPSRCFRRRVGDWRILSKSFRNADMWQWPPSNAAPRPPTEFSQQQIFLTGVSILSNGHVRGVQLVRADCAQVYVVCHFEFPRMRIFMKNFAVALLLVVGLAMAGCGSNSSSSNSANVDGNWNATLTDSGNNPAFTFGTSLVVNGDGTLSVSNFTFNSPSPCFVSGETTTGSFALSGNFNGNVTGAFQFVVKSGSPAGNTLTLMGTANGNTITGTWTLSGFPGCAGNGNFTMTKA